MRAMGERLRRELVELGRLEVRGTGAAIWVDENVMVMLAVREGWKVEVVGTVKQVELAPGVMVKAETGYDHRDVARLLDEMQAAGRRAAERLGDESSQFTLSTTDRGGEERGGVCGGEGGSGDGPIGAA